MIGKIKVIYNYIQNFLVSINREIKLDHFPIYFFKILICENMWYNEICIFIKYLKKYNNLMLTISNSTKVLRIFLISKYYIAIVEYRRVKCYFILKKLFLQL